MDPSKPQQIIFRRPPRYYGRGLGFTAFVLQFVMLGFFAVNASRIPPGTSIRPMGLALWLVQIALLGLAAVLVSVKDIVYAWNLQDRRGVWRSVGGAALGLAAGPGAFAAFYGIVNLNGLILAD